ncbi:MAG: cell division protein FtsQ/DivIB [Arachnia sp.]
MSAPEDFGRALRRRRRSSARRRIVLVVGGALFAVLAAVAIYLLWFSSVFVVDRVDVSGTRLLSLEEVTAAAEVPLGTPLASIDPDQIAARVASLDAVSAVSVTREFPDAVAIAVTERTVSYSRTSDDGYQWVDAEGVIFHHTAEAASEVPIATTSGTDQRLLADVATVVRYLPEAVRQRLVSIEAVAVDKIELKLDDGDLAVWGSADDSELKAAVLEKLLSVDASVYDVSAPSYPTTK